MSALIEPLHLHLLGGPALCRGDDQIDLPLGAHRLLGFLALQDAAVPRPVAAEALWPNQRRNRAAANLRSALWHTRRFGFPSIINCSSQMIGLTGEVSVDVRAAGRRAREIVTSPSRPGTLDGYTELLETLSRELLPGWCDEWLMIERERWDQARLHALEALARRLLTARLHLPALEVALAAAAIEPMREGAHRTIVEIHIAEGNSASAIKQYQRYRSMLHRELGIAPSQEMQRLIRSIVAG